MSTAVWLSTAVVNISLPVAGIVELRMMIFDITPPIVSMPSDSGVTSSKSISRLPVMRMSAWTAAPSATTSSGFNSLCGARPNRSATARRTSGMRVDPPTSTASSICEAVRERCGSRLVDDPQHFEAGDAAGVARRSPLRVVEIRRHGDYGAIDLGIDVTVRREECLGAVLQVPENERRDFRRGELPIAE